MSDDSEKTDQNPFAFSAFDLMPEWAQESTDDSSKSKKSEAKKSRPSKGDEHSDDKRPRFQDRGKKRGGGGDGRRDFSQRGGGGGYRDRRGSGGGGRGRRSDDRGGRGGRGKGRDRRGGGNRRGFSDQRDRQPRGPRLPKGVDATIEPTTQMLDQFEKHVRETFRTYPLIDLAKMVLASRDRYQVRFRSDADKGGPEFYRCKSDESLWLSRDEAVAHILRSDSLTNYYQVNEVDIGEPKGNFNVVAVCGMSGEILGPPNHHEYQLKVARLHAERFSNMSLERFKSRINMANDEETIEKWKQQVSKTLHYRLKSEGEPEAEVEGDEEVNAADPETEIPDEVEETEELQSDQNEESDPEDTTPKAEESVAEEDEGESEPESEADTESETEEEESEQDSESEPEPVSEPKDDELVLKSQEELRHHFRENFADEEIVQTREAVVSGNTPGKNLSPPLLELLKRETEKLRRGFPLPMIQTLCNVLEKRHLRFFKRGKKALHVSAVRPTALGESVSLTDRVQKIVDFVSISDGKTRRDVAGLLDALVPDFEKPKSKEEAAKVELSDASRAVLTDLRWLTSEGYVLEFPDTRLALGKQKFQPQKKKQPKAKKPKPEEKQPGSTGLDEAPNPVDSDTQQG